jgi:UDP-N-acetylmuramoylalanine--D-glutamate ligase
MQDKPVDAAFRGRRVTVMGLGRFGGGLGVTRWLAGQGAIVTVSDQAKGEELTESIAALADLDVRIHVGGHDEADLTRCDLLVVNPAVPFDSPHLLAAKRAGVEMTTEINLFLQRCPAAVVGITGSSGKSTTTAMTGAMLATHLPAHVGGNIGISLLSELEGMGGDHVVALELSSFQLAYLPLLHRSPRVAVVTNLQPNHLDRHKDMADYGNAKKNIFAFQGPGDILVLNRRDVITSAWAADARGQVVYFDFDDEPFLLPLPGRHNQANAQAAWQAARRFGVSRQQAQAALRDFRGLRHRLELVATARGVRCYDDSKCTTPDEAVVAIESFPERSGVFIAGGYDKKIDMSRMYRALAGKAKAVVAIGQIGPQVAAEVERLRGQDKLPIVVRAKSFEQAVRAGAELAAEGDVLVLAPGCASFDMFKNYEQRGDCFAKLVQEL